METSFYCQNLQAVKHEYGADLAWQIPFPGDWHLLKNYQMPFFDAGLRELATATHLSRYKVQLQDNTSLSDGNLGELIQAHASGVAQDQSTDTSLKQRLTSAVEQLQDNQEDQVATNCVLRSLQEEMEELALLSNFLTIQGLHPT